MTEMTATVRFLIPLTSPLAFEPSAATTFIGLMPRARRASKTASRLSASIDASCRAPSEVL